MLSVRFTLVLGLVFALTSGVHAAVIEWDFSNPPTAPTIAEVNAAGGLRVGDKVFTNFDVTPTALNSALAPDATSIKLAGVLIDGELGIRFSGLWQAAGRELADTVIMFKVTADAPFLITDNTLKMTAYLADNGGSVTISENVYAADPGVTHTTSIAHKEVYSTDYITKEFDHQEFMDEYAVPLALSEIWVVKDVGASSGMDPDFEGIASISSFYQTFSQIPEPATMMLLFCGGAAMVARRRRR